MLSRRDGLIHTATFLISPSWWQVWIRFDSRSKSFHPKRQDTSNEIDSWKEEHSFDIEKHLRPLANLSPEKPEEIIPRLLLKFIPPAFLKTRIILNLLYYSCLPTSSLRLLLSGTRCALLTVNVNPRMPLRVNFAITD